MQYYRFYKDGFLPSSGAIDHQSPIVLHAFEVIGNEMEKIKEQENGKRNNQ